MNPETQPNPVPIKPANRPKRIRPDPVPRRIDPDIAALRAQHNAAVATLKVKRRSAAITKTFLGKRFALITEDDRQKISEVLGKTITPALIDK